MVSRTGAHTPSSPPHAYPPQFVGQSPAMLRVLEAIRRMSRSDATVLVTGETGTGKELALGARREHPFVPVNCGAIPDGLFESEFFGHVRGAFTDARAHNKGLVAGAEGGTLFLDEVEALSAKGQMGLLRFLQDHTYRPLGDSQLLLANVRVVAASNTDIHQLVKSGAFRQDLLDRLRVLSVTMPPLCERGGDVVLLVEHFLNRLARLYKTEPRTLDAESLERVMRYHWPGNVRELESVLHEQFLLTDGTTIRIDRPEIAGSPTSPPEYTPSPLLGIPFELGFRTAKAHVVHQFERTFLARALMLSQGNVSEAARRCGKDRRSLGRLLKKHGIDPQDYWQLACGAEGGA